MILPPPSRGAGFWSQLGVPKWSPRPIPKIHLKIDSKSILPQAPQMEPNDPQELPKWSPKSQDEQFSMKLWTSILAAIYNTLATFGHLQLDPNASKENFHIAFGTADPPYHKMCQIEWIWRPIRTHPGPKNPPKIHHWPPTSAHCDP